MTLLRATPARGEAARRRLGSLVPGRGDYRGLRDGGWIADLLAGVTVAVVALPLALAFGVASGVGATAGLVTAVIAGAVAAVCGGSNLQVSGPTGAMTVVLMPIVAARGVGSVATIALLAGLLVVLAGVLGLGRLVALIPWPVVEGFTLGIALVIAAQQVPMALGVARPHGDNAALVAGRAMARFAHDPRLPVLGLLALAVVLTAVLPRLHRSLPASLIAVAVTTAAALVCGADVAVIGDLPRTLPAPAVPDLSQAMALLSPAVAVAALAALESLLSARVADGMADLPRHDPNRELVGQGLANIASSLFGGMPATGAIARTAVNARAGARTRLSALTHAVVLAALMAVAAGVVGRIPLAALAGVLLVTAYRMVERHAVRAVLRSTRTDAAVFALTATATVVFDLVIAVEIGIVLAVVIALVHLTRTAQIVEDDRAVAEIASDEEHELLRQHVLVYRLDGPLFFGAASRFLAQLTTVSDVRVVVLRLGNLAMLDATGARVLAEIIQQFDDRGIAVVLKVASPTHVKLLRTVGALDRLDPAGHVASDLPTALEHARKHALRGARAHTEPAPAPASCPSHAATGAR
ncbi:MAG: SulP family inorganic anion transporter [Actinomycetes bacterium]